MQNLFFFFGIAYGLLIAWHFKLWLDQKTRRYAALSLAGIVLLALATSTIANHNLYATMVFMFPGVILLLASAIRKLVIDRQRVAR